MEAKGFKHINPQILKAIAHHSHNRQLPAELVKIFAEDVQPLLVRFGAALESRDLESLQFLAHRIKGSSLNVGAKAMSELCAQLESALARKLDANQARSLLKKLESAKAETMLEFQRMFREELKKASEWDRPN